jgi:pilus assembly protein TadC
MSVGLALALVAAATVLWPSQRAVVAARTRASSRVGVAATGSREPAGTRTRWLLAGAAGLAVALLVGNGWGVVAGGAVAVAADRLLRRETPDATAREQAALAHDLPGICDLLAVCLAAGLPVPGALSAVAEAVPEPAGPRLRTVAARLRLGAAPREAWSGAPAGLAALGRVLVRAGESGSAAVPALRALAADARAAARTATEAAVRRAGVWVLAPLGACFLPAFVCLGVVPLVLGIAGDVFG